MEEQAQKNHKEKEIFDYSVNFKKSEHGGGGSIHYDDGESTVDISLDWTGDALPKTVISLGEMIQGLYPKIMETLVDYATKNSIKPPTTNTTVAFPDDLDDPLHDL